MGEGAMVVQYDGTVVLFASGHAPTNSSAAAANPCQTPWKIQTIAFKAHFCYLNNSFFKKYCLFRKNNNFKSKADEYDKAKRINIFIYIIIYYLFSHYI